ncbi:MAG: response regulator, partial [Chloroflexi bacterium]|nr:response regulator [Chloroflexota bacterium]
HLKLWVQDGGAGVSREEMARLFEPFFSTKAKGRGMGLPIVYGIVRRHNGFIQAESPARGGTLFTVYLPAASDAAAVVAQPAAPTTPRGGQELILLAEDEAPMRRLLEERLRASGYRVLAAADGQQAYRLFQQHAREIDAAIIDMQMPGLAGEELCALMGQQRPGLPVLISSGYATPHHSAHRLADLRVDVLLKPYDLPTLLGRLRGLLDV